MNVKSTVLIQAAVDSVKLLNQKMAQLEAAKKKDLEAIKNFMETTGADVLLNTLGDGIIGTYKERGGTLKFDATEFKADHPKLYKQYTKPSPTFKVFLTK